ncbi:MAG: hypothetical protein ABI836_09690 [Gemmatimonadota bacterium]
MARCPADASLADPLTSRRWIALLSAVAGAVVVLGMLDLAARARRAEFLAANSQIASAVAGYLTVVAPVDGGSEYQLIGLLSAVHTLAASPRWRRGIQVAWGNSPLLPDSLNLAPLDTTTMRLLAQPSGSAFVERGGLGVGLVPLLDRDLGHSIGWVAAWGTLAFEGRSLTRLGLLALIAVAGLTALGLPAALLPNRTRWWLVVVAGAGAILLAVHEDHRVQQLASRREALVVDRVNLLVERALTMPRIDRKHLGRIEAGADQRLTVRTVTRELAAGAGLLVLFVLWGAWSRMERMRLEKTERTENGAPLSS